MVSVITTALSGYAAATQRLNVSANNIANASTTRSAGKNGDASGTPYVPQEITQFTGPQGGVTTGTKDVTPASFIRQDTDGSIVQSPNVDVAQQLVQARIATYDARGNLSVIKAEQKNTQSLLDIIS